MTLIIRQQLVTGNVQSRHKSRHFHISAESGWFVAVSFRPELTEGVPHLNGVLSVKLLHYFTESLSH